MTIVQLYRRADIGSLCHRVQDYAAGIKLIQYLVSEVLNSETAGFAVELRYAGGWYLQVFVSAQHADDRAEGWRLPREGRRALKDNVDRLVISLPGEPLRRGFFAARFAQGVQISKKLLVSDKTIRRVLSAFEENNALADWFDNRLWINVGLI